MAIEGRQLLDAGQPDAAARVLTDYKARNTATMLEIAAELLQHSAQLQTTNIAARRDIWSPA